MKKIWIRSFIVLLGALLLLLPFWGKLHSTQEGETGKSTNQESVSETLEVHFLDVGQADAALLRCGEASMLIDGGNREDGTFLVAYLAENQVTGLSYVIASHPHEDHVGGLLALSCPVEQIYSPVTDYDSETFQNFLSWAGQKGQGITIPSVGETFPLGEAKVQVLSPNRAYETTNDKSIVLKVSLGNVSFLFMGDAEWEAEHDLLETKFDLRTTVLKVGHHGSASSTSYRFLREVMPEYAVISVGAGNRYGHPEETVLSRLRDADVQTYRTDEQGTIVLRTDGTKVEVMGK